MNIKESIEKYGKEFTKRVVGEAVIACGGTNGNWAMDNKKNFLHDECIKAGLFTSRRKESLITIYKGYKNVYSTEYGYTRVNTKVVTILSKDRRTLYNLIFTDEELREGLLR